MTDSFPIDNLKLISSFYRKSATETRRFLSFDFDKVVMKGAHWDARYMSTKEKDYEDGGVERNTCCRDVSTKRKCKNLNFDNNNNKISPE